MIELKRKDKEVDINLKFYKPLGKKLQISIIGEGDFSHHLIEALFDIIDELSGMENCCHLSKEWIELSNKKIKARMREL